MYTTSLTRLPDVYSSHNITISPDGISAPIEPDGDVNLYDQAINVFSRLHEPNDFTASTNTFRTIVVQRLQTTSDGLLKTDVTPVDGVAATRRVRRTPMYHYRLDGVPTAGVLAQDLPDTYTMRHPVTGHLTVDYQGLLAELWASVSFAHDRLDAIAAHQEVEFTSEIPRRSRHGHTEYEITVQPVDDGVAGVEAESLPDGIV
jgi:hypothetical protein